MALISASGKAASTARTAGCFTTAAAAFIVSAFGTGVAARLRVIA
jgi:hypothetical protein